MTPRETIISDDWTKNWKANIALKVSAIVIWILVVVGVGVSALLAELAGKGLVSSYEEHADKLAYRIANIVTTSNSDNTEILKLDLHTLLSQSEFSKIDITLDKKTISLGHSVDVSPNTFQREIFLDKSKKDKIVITAHAPDFKNLIIEKRKKFMIITLGVLLVFGAFLNWVINLIITKPTQTLVSTTRAISNGNLNTRLDINRNDEYGELATFFNQMLDNLESQRNELEEAVLEAKTANRAKSAFLATMSHEIRTPLTAIIGFADAALDRDQSDEERDEHIRTIMQSGDHLQYIINDILDLSKIEAGKLEIEHIEFSPLQLLDEIDHIIRPKAEEKSIGLAINYEFPLPSKITSDPLRLKQIIINLCSNAIKFTEKGHVSIKVSHNVMDNILAFDVVDTGIGLTKSQSVKIFNPFTQADSSTTREYGGTGLGLSISNQLAELLGGNISVVSQPNKGSKFTVTIDPGEIDNTSLIYNLNRKVPQDTRKNKNALIPHVSGNILLAEDTPVNQTLFKRIIEKTNATLTMVDNGQLALDAVLEANFDLILMDMQMPIMDGMQAVKELRRQNYKGPIVALTANVMKEDQEKYLAAGCDDFLAKPLDKPKLYEVIARYLQDANKSQVSPISIRSNIA